jgi:hypothetical protein
MVRSGPLNVSLGEPYRRTVVGIAVADRVDKTKRKRAKKFMRRSDLILLLSKRIKAVLVCAWKNILSSPTRRLYDPRKEILIPFKKQCSHSRLINRPVRQNDDVKNERLGKNPGKCSRGWLFFRVARSTGMIQIAALRSRLENQPTDLRETQGI